MSHEIIKRGPDDVGYWLNPKQGMGLAHRRLSIVDLTSAGHQPMQSESGRYTIAFNGEIYNHSQMRQKLIASGVAPKWKGSSDTEVLISGFDAWGIEGTMRRARGMFAFAVWDNDEDTVILGRDRIGEKPLYYGWQGDAFLFGSELSALKQHPDFKSEINRGAITLLLRHNYIPAPYSIYQGISKLEPGHLLSISTVTGESKMWSYWSSIDTAMASLSNPFMGAPNDSVDELERLMEKAISQQMVSDVPLGAFLSGGIDSSAVAALMQGQSIQPIKTFAIGFHEEGYDEAVHAKMVAKHLGTDHTELYVTPEEARAVIPNLSSLYSEPFADSSQIPTFLLSKLAKKHVGVSLSGDAGDELFCGYNRYQITDKFWNRISKLPIPLRSVLAKSIDIISPQAWNNFANYIPGAKKINSIGSKLHKGASVLTSRTVDELYQGLVSHYHDPASLVIGAKEPSTLLTSGMADLSDLSDIQRMMILDLVMYLPDDILVKVDRAAMGVSLETRMPFLDHRIVEFSWSLPQSIKLREGQTKWPLRQMLYRYVPKELVERPKMGFGIPLDSWLRGPLRDWAENLLDESRLKQEGFFHPALIRQKWEEHLSCKRNWQSLLWSVLMFQAWLEENKK